MNASEANSNVKNSNVKNWAGIAHRKAGGRSARPSQSLLLLFERLLRATLLFQLSPTELWAQLQLVFC